MNHPLCSKKPGLKGSLTPLSFTIILQFLILSVNGLSAQTGITSPQISWSNLQKAKAVVYEDVEMLKSDSNAIYFFNKLKNAEPMLGIPTIYEMVGKYNMHTDSVSYVTLNLKSNDANRVRLNVMMCNDKLHIFSYFNNKSQNAVYIFDETIDMQSFIINDDIHKIGEIKYDKSRISSSGDILIQLKKTAINGVDHLLLSYNYKTNSGKTFGYELFNQQLTSLAKYEDNYESNTSIPNCAFDKEYNLYTVERRFGDAILPDYTSSTIVLHSYPKNGTQPIRKELKIENKFITEQTISINEKGELVCIGLYANKEQRSATGIFSTKYTPKLEEIGELRQTDLEYDFLCSGLSEKEAKSLRKDLEKGKDYEKKYLYHFQNIHFRTDGSFSLVVEKKMKEYFYKGFNNGGYYIYRYNDIYALSFLADGSLKWKQKVYRNEVFNDEIFYTHFVGECFIENGADGEINILHNKFNIENKDVYSGSPLKEGKSLLTTIDAEGKVTEKIIDTDPSVTRNICPKISQKDTNGGKYSVMKINFISITNPLAAMKRSSYTFNLGKMSIK